MKAADLKIELKNARIPDDAQAQAIICGAFRTLRTFLVQNVTGATGVGGVVFRALFPKTAEGIKQVVTLLDDYLAANCG